MEIPRSRIYPAMKDIMERKNSKAAVIQEIYRILFGEYGCRGWWPVTPRGGTVPEYSGGPVDQRQKFEVCCGAVLTQNTSWKNASSAIINMNREGLLDPGDIIAVDLQRLAGIIRPSGYYNTKALKLKRIARFLSEKRTVTRKSILSVNGVGPETADSIMLYAFGKLFFVIDSYTRRIFSRVGVIKGDEQYESIRKLFEDSLPADIFVYREYHSLIVEHAKRYCLKRNPSCPACPLEGLCPSIIEE
jgi:endonuclease-3 related protein